MNNREPNSTETRSGLKSALLVIGYGNTLRGDDGVGPRVAEAVAAMALPGVRTLGCHQLAPEHAEAISRADRVVFVDAAVDAAKKVQFRRLEPNGASQLMAHAPTRAPCWPWPATCSATRRKRGGSRSPP